MKASYNNRVIITHIFMNVQKIVQQFFAQLIIQQIKSLNHYSDHLMICTKFAPWYNY